MNAETDTSLFERWRRQGDARAFHEIARRHSQMVFATCRRILRDAGEAEDAAQECFLRLAQHAKRAPESLPAWLHVVAVRTSLNRLRARRRQTAREHAYSAAQPVTTGQPTDTLLSEVDAALATLPEALRTPLVLHFLEQRMQEQVAAELGVSQSTVSRRIDQGIAQLRTVLKVPGAGLTAGALAVMFQAESQVAVPLSLNAALGKLSLAGNAAVMASPSAFSIVGVLVMKKMLAAVAVLLLAGVALWKISSGNPQIPPSEGPVVAESEGEQPGAPVDDRPTSGERFGPAGAPEQAVVQTSTASTTSTANGAISGRVYDAKTGEGIAGVEVSAERSGPGRPANGAERSTSAITEEDGTYSFIGLSADPGTVFRLKRDTPPGYRRPSYMEEREVIIDSSGNAQNVDFPLHAEAILSGVVVDEHDRPVPNAQVILAGGTDFYVGESKDTAADGTFSYHTLPPSGDLHLVASKGDAFASEPYSFTLPEEGMSDVVLTLLAACSVEGIVVDSAGEPVADCSVLSLRVPHTRVGTGHSEKTGVDGRFQITGLGPGTYELVANKSNNTGANQQGVPVELSPGQQLTDITVVYGHDLTISGRVTNMDGEPVGGVEVRAGSSQLGGDSATSGDDGTFSIPNLAEGDYQLDVYAKEYQALMLSGIPAGTQDLKIMLASPFRITGRVIDATTNQPLPQFEIVLSVGWQDSLDSWAAKQFKQVSHPEGRFELTQIQLYRSVLAARAPGYSTAMQFLDLTGPPYAHEIELKLQHGGDLQGRVVDDFGAPIASAQVYMGKITAIGDRASAITGPEGTFGLPSFPAQPQLISVYHPNYAPSARVVTGGARLQPVEIVLSAGGTVEGMVTFGEGVVPLPSRVMIGYAEEHYIHDAFAEVGPDGAYTLDRVGPGEVEVRLVVSASSSGEDRYSIIQTASVTPGAVTTVNFEVPGQTAHFEGVVKPPAGALMSRIQLNLRSGSDAGTATRIALVRPDGRFEFPAVLPGPAELEIDAMFQNHVRIHTTIPVDISGEGMSGFEIQL